MLRNLAFIGKGIGLALIAIIPYYYILLQQTKQQDPLYYKAIYHSPYLTLGASRAQRGIVPAVLEEELQLPTKALNFAFTAANSPYGEPYYNLVRRKLGRSTTRPGLFLLSVHPVMVMDYELARGRREEEFRFYDLYLLNWDPNPEYIFRNIENNRALLPILLRKRKSRRQYDTIHDDGWKESNLPDSIRPQSLEELRIQPHVTVRSPNRELWLRRTVAHLRQYGQVVFVRIPTAKVVQEKEQEIAPYFDSFIQELATIEDVPYLDYRYLGDSLNYYDSFHHLDGSSARAFTRQLTEDLKERGIWKVQE